MPRQTVAEMTLDELQAFVTRLIDDRLSRVQPWPSSPQERSPAEVWESMLKNIIKPGPGEPSALEMLFEERDKWYKNG